MQPTKQQIETKAKEITDYLYDAYGSGYGVLFGIPPNCKEAIYKIVELTLEKCNRNSAEIDNGEVKNEKIHTS